MKETCQVGENLEGKCSAGCGHCDLKEGGENGMNELYVFSFPAPAAEGTVKRNEPQWLVSPLFDLCKASTRDLSFLKVICRLLTFPFSMAMVGSTCPNPEQPTLTSACPLDTSPLNPNGWHLRSPVWH